MGELILENVIVRRTRYARRAAVVAFGIALMILGARWGGQACFVCGCIITYFGAMRAFLLEERRRNVTASRDTLHLGDIRIDRARVLEGIVVPCGSFATVVLYLRRSIGRVEIDMPSTARAEELLASLDLDTSARAATFWTPAPRGYHVPLFERAFAFVPARVVVGTEGVRVVWLAKDRVFRYADAAFAVVEERVTITPHGSLEIAIDVDRASCGLSQRIARAIEARGGAEEDAGAFEATLLARGERPTRAWLGAVRAIGREANGGYRGSAIPRERLLAIAEDASQREDVRAAAAIAVAPSLDRVGRARLDRAAIASVSPSLRGVFVGIGDAHADDDHIATALDRVS